MLPDAALAQHRRSVKVIAGNVTRPRSGRVTFGGLAKYRLAQMFKFSTKACGGILPNHCYKPFLFVFGLTILN